MPHCDLVEINRVPRLGARRALVPLAVAALLTLAPEAAAQVVNERFDRFTLPNRTINWIGVGVFFVRNGAIAEWSDFTIRMG